MLAELLAAPPPGTIRDRAGEILRRPEFRHHKSILQRIGEWIADQLARFSFGVGNGPGFLGNAIGLLILVAAAVLVFLLVRSFRRTGRRREDDGVVVESTARRSADDWRRAAEELEQAGRWREAMRARYAELVRALIDDGVVSDVAGRTSGEYRTELTAALPDRASDIAALTELFESAWYGAEPVDRADHEKFRSLVARVRTEERELVGAS